MCRTLVLSTCDEPHGRADSPENSARLRQDSYAEVIRTDSPISILVNVCDRAETTGEGLPSVEITL